MPVWLPNPPRPPASRGQSTVALTPIFLNLYNHMTKQIKYILFILSTYQESLKNIVIGFTLAKKLTPGLLALMFSIKIW